MTVGAGAGFAVTVVVIILTVSPFGPGRSTTVVPPGTVIVRTGPGTLVGTTTGGTTILVGKITGGGVTTPGTAGNETVGSGIGMSTDSAGGAKGNDKGSTKSAPNAHLPNLFTY